MSFVEQLDGYFLDFGETVVMGTTTATGIVDAPVDAYNGVLANAMDVTIIADRITGVATNDSATIRGVSYTVRSIEPDGTGLALVRLTRP